MRSLYFIFTLLGFTSCNHSGNGEKKDPARSEDTQLTGKELSLRYCQSCHLYPGPKLLDKATWEKNVLVKMGYLMGIYGDTLRSSLIEGGAAGQAVLAAGVFPEKPALSASEWEKIVRYYVSEAPDTLVNRRERRAWTGLDSFRAIVPDFRTQPPMTTLVRIDEEMKRVYVGDAKGDISSLTILDNRFNILNTMYIPTPPSGLHRIGDSLCITMMGRVWPTDAPTGGLIKAFRTPGDDRYRHFKKMAGDLRRPVHTVFADLTGNGLDDLIICEYGNHIGSLSWFENTGSEYKKKVLLNQPGAVRAYAADMNRDKRIDIVALTAQGDEALWIFYNRGDGRFEPERVLRFPPVYGSIYFEIVDINHDGWPDILYCNGDNGDYYPVLKDYHGIRVFENDGKNRFTETFFFPMDGVYKASAADFDKDGDLDIFAIAFYPDFSQGREESMVYLENTGGYRYTPRGVRAHIPGRWITFDTGDIDGDGDLDILLGSYTGFTTFADTTGQLDKTQRAGRSLLLLQNQLIRNR